MVKIAIIILCLFICGCTLFLGTPLEREIHSIQLDDITCLDKALKIGIARAKENLLTTIVIAYVPHFIKCDDGRIKMQDNGGWHAFWRDENGKLRDVSARGIVFGVPMFEFNWELGMDKARQHASGLVMICRKNVTKKEKLVVLSFRVSPHSPQYKLLTGKEKVKRLRKSR